MADPEYGHQGLGLRLCEKCHALCSHLLCIVCISHQLDAAELDEEGEDVDGGPGHEEHHGEQRQQNVGPQSPPGARAPRRGLHLGPALAAEDAGGGQPELDVDAGDHHHYHHHHHHHHYPPPPHLE